MPTILCIEDEADLRADIAEELKEAGFSVIEAGDGKEGLEMILEHSPDLVTCDINMPRLNGKELLRELRDNHPQFAQMPFLFLTAYATRAHMIEGIQLGVDDYITKPVDFDLLIAKIHQRLLQVKNIVARKNRELLTLYNKYLDMQSSAMAQQSKAMPTNLRDIPIVVIGKLEREIKAFVSVASEVFTNITLFPDVDTYLAKRQGFPIHFTFVSGGVGCAGAKLPEQIDVRSKNNIVVCIKTAEHHARGSGCENVNKDQALSLPTNADALQRSMAAWIKSRIQRYAA